MARRDFRDKVVVVTGGAGGLGQAFAHRFSASGARVAVLDLDGAAATQAATDLAARGGDALGLACDVTQEKDCRAALARVKAHFGGIDVLINNAGITHRSAFSATSAQVFAKVMAVNYFGALYCTQAALPSIIARRGLIITISSIAGISPLLGRSGYAASKHALHGLFGSLRAELSGSGVGVMLVCPGFTNTGIAGAALDGDGTLTSHPQSTVGRVATPAEVAWAVFRAAQHDRRLLVLSTIGRLTHLLMRLAPGLYERLMARSLKRELER